MRIKDGQALSWANSQPTSGTVDDNALVQLLAALGDSPTQDQAALVVALAAPDMTRAKQLELVRAGLDAAELEDVAELLNELGPRLSPGGRNFLEALLGRAALDVDAPLLQVNALDGNLSGMTLANATVEAVNLSTAPAGFARLEDAVTVGNTDAWGRFQGALAGAQAGDVLRVRARDTQGRQTDWVNVRAGGAGGDQRAAYVALNRIRLEAQPGGTVALSHHTSRPLTEPGAKLRFTNTATGAFSDVTVDFKGSIPKGLTLPGNPGDTISVAVSDGVGNTNLGFVAGTLTVPPLRSGGNLQDPAPLNKDASASTTRFNAPVTVDGASSDDVKQGAIGNCYVPASLAAVAHANPRDIDEIIEDRGDGTFTVRLYPVDNNGFIGDPVFVDVDADLVTDWGGRPRYASTTGWARGSQELWVSLIEKAYAQFRGGYEVVAQGGSVGAMQATLLGRPNVEHWTNSNTPDQLWNALMAGAQEKRAMSAGTFGTVEAARYSGTGVHANHAYSVLGGVEENGEKLVILRNPWGSGEPTGNGADDGVFKLKLSEFIRLYQVLNVC